ANNLALRRYGIASDRPDTRPAGGGARYVLLLNPDTVVPPTALRDLVAFLDAHPAIGVVGPKVLRPDGRLDLACRRSFPTPAVALYRMVGLSRLFPRSRRFGRYNLTYLDPDQPAEVDAVMGACMMVRSAAIEQAGLLDERFFLYGEDLDWALRIKQQGWKVVYYPQVMVLHHKGASSRRASERSLREFYRAMLIFYRKHYAAQTFFLVNWLIVTAIYLWGTVAYIRNQLRPKDLRRVSG
ncbi:MAG: glycosyltransferase family 2 protein, partial [Chloroflexi bacterium]|nr:glycosyltransferase family 2 protein [Chloroflexota bacterium]